MNVLWVNIAVFRKLFLAVLFCCALLGIGFGNFAVSNLLEVDLPGQFTMALFAQDSDASQPESPLEEPLEGAAAQPESPLAEPESKSEEAAVAQPESPLEEPEPIATVEPTVVPSKTPEPTATTMPTAAPTATATVEAEPTATSEPTATAEPTAIVVPTETGVLTGTTMLTSTTNISTTQIALITQTTQTESAQIEGEQDLVQVIIGAPGTQALTRAPGAAAELLGLLASTGTRPLFLTENLILALLCLIAFSVMWLGLCALSVCLFYIRSRQPSQINDYASTDRQMIVHYRR